MSKLTGLESYVFPAKRGDNGRYKILFDAFIKEGLLIFKTIQKSYSFYTIEKEEIIEVLTLNFMRILDNYRRKNGTFENYAKRSMEKTLKSYCLRKISRLNQPCLSLDMVQDDGFTLLDSLPSEDYTKLRSSIDNERFIFKIASKSSSSDQTEKQISRMILYRYQGFSREEICKKLRITEGRYRYLLRKIEEDEDLMNIKIDLK